MEFISSFRKKAGLGRFKKKSALIWIWNWFPQQQWFKSHLGPLAILILEVLRAQNGSNLAAEFTFSFKQSPTEESTTKFHLKLITAIPKSMLKYELEVNVFSVWENWTWQVGKLLKILFSKRRTRKRKYRRQHIKPWAKCYFVVY